MAGSQCRWSTYSLWFYNSIVLSVLYCSNTNNSHIRQDIPKYMLQHPWVAEIKLHIVINVVVFVVADYQVVIHMHLRMVKLFLSTKYIALVVTQPLQRWQFHNMLKLFVNNIRTVTKYPKFQNITPSFNINWYVPRPISTSMHNLCTLY